MYANPICRSNINGKTRKINSSVLFSEMEEIFYDVFFQNELQLDIR